MQAYKEKVMGVIDSHIKRLNGSSTLETIKDEIDKIPEDNGWISVYERLPDAVSEEFFVFDSVRNHPNICLFNGDTGHFALSPLRMSITHWMPIPLPSR